jgi:hypothetical protein
VFFKERLLRRLAWLRSQRWRQRQRGELVLKRAEERLSKPGVSRAQRTRILEPLLAMCERLDALERRTKDMIGQVEVELLAAPVRGGESDLVIDDRQRIRRSRTYKATTGPPRPQKRLRRLCCKPEAPGSFGSGQLKFVCAGRILKSYAAKNPARIFGTSPHARDGRLFVRRISRLPSLSPGSIVALRARGPPPA